MPDLNKLRVAVIATDGFEEAELAEPVRALREAGAEPVIVAPHSGSIQAFRHQDKAGKVNVDLELDKAQTDSFDAVMLPGGALNADQLRINPKLQSFLRSMNEADKPFAVICHAPWELVSAGLVRGRRLTSYHTIQDDIRNAGGQWLDQEVVTDRNWVTSRQPDDIPAFNREMISLLSGRRPSLMRPGNA